MKLKEKYNKLKTKYSLPEYNELNMNFDIEEIDTDSSLILAKIRAKIHDKLDVYANLIGSIVQPDTTLIEMYEAKYIDDKARETAYLLFKQLMELIRYSNLVSLNNTEEENAIFIKESFSKWNSMKKELMLNVERLIGLWKKDTNIRNDLSYFG